MTRIDMTFPHTYTVEEVGDYPGTGRFTEPVICIPPPGPRGERDGLWIRVRAGNGNSWIGHFAFEYPAPPSTSRIISTPDPNRVCFVAKGAAYFVNADQPELWEKLPLMPVTDVKALPETDLLVFSDFTRLIAYARDGISWKSPRVCWDGLTISRMTVDVIEGIGYDPTNAPSYEMPFLVDTRTGRSLLPLPPLFS